MGHIPCSILDCIRDEASTYVAMKCTCLQLYNWYMHLWTLLPLKPRHRTSRKFSISALERVQFALGSCLIFIFVIIAIVVVNVLVIVIVAVTIVTAIVPSLSIAIVVRPKFAQPLLTAGFQQCKSRVLPCMQMQSR